MKNNKSKSIIFALSMVTLLVVSSVSSFGVSTGSIGSNSAVSATNVVSGSGNCLRMSKSSSSRLNVLVQSTGIEGLGTSFVNESGVFVVSNDPGNESNPSMVVEGPKAFIAYEYYYDNMTQIRLRSSKNYGMSWSDPGVFGGLENFNISSPAFDKNPGPEEPTAYGVFISDVNNSGIIYEVLVPDIKNAAGAVADDIDWSVNGFYNFTDTDIVTYPEDNCKWVIGLIGSTTYENETTGEGPCADAPMFCFDDPEPPYEYNYIAWEPAFENCSNLSLGRDHYSDSEIVYAVCEQNNGSNQDLLLIIGTPDDWIADPPLPFVNQTFTD